MHRKAICLLAAISTLSRLLIAATPAPNISSIVNEEERLRSIRNLSNLPAGTQVYALDTYGIQVGSFSREIPANVTIKRTVSGTVITYQNGATEKLPASALVAFRPKSDYVYVYPVQKRPPITFTRIAHRIR